jgi:hypothetical protein
MVISLFLKNIHFRNMILKLDAYMQGDSEKKVNTLLV